MVLRPSDEMYFIIRAFLLLTTIMLLATHSSVAVECGVQAPGNSPWKYRPLLRSGTGKNRIVSGQSAKSGSWPWQVALYRKEANGDPFFGGAVLTKDPEILLTAAHIIDDALGKPIIYAAGTNKVANIVSDPDVDYGYVLSYVTHKDFDKQSVNNDIALLRIEKPIRFGPKKIPPCLPALRQEPGEGSRCAVTGFGLLKEYTNKTGEGPQLPALLQEAYVNVVDRQKCNKTGGDYLGQITEQMICAAVKDGAIDACQGDSGGPFVCKTGSVWTLFGLMSWGSGCAVPNNPGVYTKVSNFLDWIETNSEALKAAPVGSKLQA